MESATGLMNLTDYHAKYFAYELTKRSPSDSVDKLAGVVAGAQQGGTRPRNPGGSGGQRPPDGTQFPPPDGSHPPQGGSRPGGPPSGGRQRPGDGQRPGGPPPAGGQRPGGGKKK